MYVVGCILLVCCFVASLIVTCCPVFGVVVYCCVCCLLLFVVRCLLFVVRCFAAVAGLLLYVFFAAC